MNLLYEYFINNDKYQYSKIVNLTNYEACNYRDPMGYTPIYQYIKKSDTVDGLIVSILINNVNLEYTYDDGCNILHEYCKRNDVGWRVVKMIISMAKIPIGLEDMFDNFGFIPFDYYFVNMERLNKDVIYHLCGPLCVNKLDVDGNTYLMRYIKAIDNPDPDIICILKEFCIINTVNNYGETALSLYLKKQKKIDN